MAGIGPAPKPSHRRARTNADPVANTTLPFQRCEPPELPEPLGPEVEPLPLPPVLLGLPRRPPVAR